MNLETLCRGALTDRRDAPALEWKERVLTFGEVDARAHRMARALARRGLARGDRLAVWLANRPELIDLYLACARLGVIFVPINVLYRERELDHILRDSTPRALVAAGPPPAAGSIETWNVDALATEAGGQSAEPLLTSARPDGRTPAALIYTSGTTGPAKGAVLTGRNFAANALRLLEAWGVTSADRLLLALPLFHVHGLGNGLHCWLAAGARMRLLERFDHATAADTFLDFQPTLFFGVPTMYVRLLELDHVVARAIGARMRLFVSGSAALPAHVFEAFRQRFGHAVLERYGMTETLMNIGNPYDGERRPGTVGVPLPGVLVRLLDGEGHDVPDGAVGELFVRSESVCAGYWGRPDATREAFAGGYFRTGDLAVRSSDGYYTLQGRRSDVIISGGFNIYPREIEELLLEQGGVAEAAVVGRPDALRGEVPVAFIVARDPAKPPHVSTLDALCRQKLASFKVPRAFVLVDRIPRTALGKVQKHLLNAEPPEPPEP
ncbi:MAG TPA: acyl-CoA synthetase [Vicinamibacterales bacterium]|nr:acyl-CoA synthetase [Vicinamibacterales bacterium]